MVSNRIPVKMTFVSATGGATPSSGILLINLGLLAIGAVTNAQIIVQPTSAGKLTNLFQVFASTTDPVLTNNSVSVISTVTNPPPVLADLSLIASAAPEPVGVGSNLVYSITISNAGPATASGIVISNHFSANEAFVSANRNNAFLTLPTTFLLVEPNPLAAGASDTYQVVVRPLVAGNLTNLFQISATQTDPVLTNNSVMVVSTVTNPPPPVLADLSLTASAAPEPVGVGSNLVYTLSVTNLGPAAASGVTVSNRIPTGITFVSATGGATPSSGSLLINLGSLATGAVTNAQITVQPTAAGKLTNLFRVFAGTADPVLTNNSASVVSTVTNAPANNSPLDVALSITAAPNPVNAGCPLTYLLTVTNKGSTTATGVVVSNTLPFGVKLVSLLPSQGSATTNRCTDIILFNVGTLPHGDLVTLAIVVIPTVAGCITDKAVAFSQQRDAVPTNNYAQVTTTVSKSGRGCGSGSPPTNCVPVHITCSKPTRDGCVPLQFSATPGRIYAIQYSSDLMTWHTTAPAITATNNCVDWIDAGPPQTPCKPAGDKARYYRVVLLPAN